MDCFDISNVRVPKLVEAVPEVVGQLFKKAVEVVQANSEYAKYAVGGYCAVWSVGLSLAFRMYDVDPEREGDFSKLLKVLKFASVFPVAGPIATGRAVVQGSMGVTTAICNNTVIPVLRVIGNGIEYVGKQMVRFLCFLGKVLVSVGNAVKPVLDFFMGKLESCMNTLGGLLQWMFSFLPFPRWSSGSVAKVEKKVRFSGVSSSEPMSSVQLPEWVQKYVPDSRIPKSSNRSSNIEFQSSPATTDIPPFLLKLFKFIEFGTQVVQYMFKPLTT